MRETSHFDRYNPWNPARKWTVGSTFGRKGMRGRKREADFQDDRGENPGGAKTQEGKVRRRLLGDISGPYPDGANL